MIQLQAKGGEHVNKKRVSYKKEAGNIILITAILILILSIITMTCVNLASSQLKLSDLDRDTSNTYTLARDGIEKQVDTINKALEAEIPQIITTMGKEYIKELTINTNEADRYKEAQSGTNEAKVKYADFGYDSTDDKILIKKKVNNTDASFAELLRGEVYNYLEQTVLVDPLKTGPKDPKPIEYEVKGDQAGSSTKTVVTITPEAVLNSAGNIDETQILIRATAKEVNGTEISDSQTVEAKVAISIPDNIEHEIREYYGWIANPSELLDSPLVNFSDLVIDGANSLDVQSGDVLVKGYLKPVSAVGGSTINDADQSGGVIVKNGGSLHVADNLYSLANVAVTNGWKDTPASSDYSTTTTLSVDGDVIANTVAIIDDYYSGSSNMLPQDNKGTNLNITVGKNVIADNDVMIDRWIENCNIDVTGTIFGISGGTQKGLKFNVDGSDVECFNPNQSSGVFSMGKGTKIKSKRMFIAGQPFITLTPGSVPLKLFESAGEPFQGVWDVDYYKDNNWNSSTFDTYNGAYLEADMIKGEVQKNKIVSDFSDSYAVARLTGLNTKDGVETIGYITTAVGPIDGQSSLWDFLFQGVVSETSGGSSVTKGYTDYATYDASDTAKDYSKIDYIVKQPANFYNGGLNDTGALVPTLMKNRLMHGKKFGHLKYESSEFKLKATDNTYQQMKDFLGVKAYATAARGVFYGPFDFKLKDGSYQLKEKILNFNNVVSLNNFSADNTWTLATPIQVVTSGTSATVDISKFYYKDGTCVPSIIVNKEKTTKLIIKTGDPSKNKFMGVIISNGPVEIQAPSSSVPLIIEGSVIIGGPENTSPSREGIYKNATNNGLIITGKVELNRNPDVLFSIDAKDRGLYRKVLDALKLTQYFGNDKLNKVLGETDNYTIGKVGYTDKSYLWVDASEITMSIITEKKKK